MSLFLRQQEGRFFVLSELQSVGRNNRLNLRDVALGGEFISIHAPTQGATTLPLLNSVNQFEYMEYAVHVIGIYCVRF